MSEPKYPREIVEAVKAVCNGELTAREVAEKSGIDIKIVRDICRSYTLRVRREFAFPNAAGLRMTEFYDARVKSRVSRYTVAADLNLCTDTIARLETGLYPKGFDTLVALADYYGVTTDYLLGREGKT